MLNLFKLSIYKNQFFSFCFNTFCVLFFSLSAFGQVLPPKQASPLNIKQIHSGHSLTDPLFNPWPGQYTYLMSQHFGVNDAFVRGSTIPGSSMSYRWNNWNDEPRYGAPDARHNIANWELLSITERVPLSYEGGSTEQWYLEGIQSQKTHLSLFVNNAWNNGNNGNGAPTLLWTTWTNIDNSNGPWRQILDIQGAEFERMQDYANTNRPSGAPPVYIIPGHKMMARLHDDIALGLVPGINSISGLFQDTIHVNDLGAYAVAMIHYACIFNTSPVGLPSRLWYSNQTTNISPSPALATYLQNMVWQVVTSYTRTGITSTLSTPTIALVNQETFTVYPNPANEFLNIQASDNLLDRNQDFQILNVLGETLITKKIEAENRIPISHLSKGIYIVKIGNSVEKFIKQ